MGINTSGYIYESFSDCKITSKSATNYIGGISGITNGGEIYKCASAGKIEATKPSDSTSYVGGITGLLPSGLVVNGYSEMLVSVLSPKAYVGGIVGYNQEGNVQNTYSHNKIETSGVESFSGGIVGYSEGGFIVDNVTIDAEIIGSGKVDGVVNRQGEMVYSENNYINENTRIDGINDIQNGGGIILKDKEMKNEEFFFKPIPSGGKLGWIMEDIWYMDKNSLYPKLVK